jgi:5-methylcytosine-specific restriction endonuclease McrA
MKYIPHYKMRGHVPWNKGLKGRQPWHNTEGLKLGVKYQKHLVKGSLNPNWKGGKPKCLVCGKLLIRYSAKHCRLHTPANRAENHHSWKGGITPLNEKIRKSLKYKLWRRAVYERDNYTCVWCGKWGGRLHADHIKPFSLYPESRFDLNNGRTLCKSCHKRTKTYGGKVFNFNYLICH